MTGSPFIHCLPAIKGARIMNGLVCTFDLTVFVCFVPFVVS
jgi:hypothetical protein